MTKRIGWERSPGETALPSAKPTELEGIAEPTDTMLAQRFRDLGNSADLAGDAQELLDHLYETTGHEQLKQALRAIIAKHSEPSEQYAGGGAAAGPQQPQRPVRATEPPKSTPKTLAFNRNLEQLTRQLSELGDIQAVLLADPAFQEISALSLPERNATESPEAYWDRVGEKIGPFGNPFGRINGFLRKYPEWRNRDPQHYFDAQKILTEELVYHEDSKTLIEAVRARLEALAVATSYSPSFSLHRRLDVENKKLGKILALAQKMQASHEPTEADRAFQGAFEGLVDAAGGISDAEKTQQTALLASLPQFLTDPNAWKPFDVSKGIWESFIRWGKSWFVSPTQEQQNEQAAHKAMESPIAAARTAGLAVLSERVNLGLLADLAAPKEHVDAELEKLSIIAGHLTTYRQKLEEASRVVGSQDNHEARALKTQLDAEARSASELIEALQTYRNTETARNRARAEARRSANSDILLENTQNALKAIATSIDSASKPPLKPEIFHQAVTELYRSFANHENAETFLPRFRQAVESLATNPGFVVPKPKYEPKTLPELHASLDERWGHNDRAILESQTKLQSIQQMLEANEAIRQSLPEEHPQLEFLSNVSAELLQQEDQVARELFLHQKEQIGLEIENNNLQVRADREDAEKIKSLNAQYRLSLIELQKLARAENQRRRATVADLAKDPLWEYVKNFLAPDEVDLNDDWLAIETSRQLALNGMSSVTEAVSQLAGTAANAVTTLLGTLRRPGNLVPRNIPGNLKKVAAAAKQFETWVRKHPLESQRFAGNIQHAWDILQQKGFLTTSWNRGTTEDMVKDMLQGHREYIAAADERDEVMPPEVIAMLYLADWLPETGRMAQAVAGQVAAGSAAFWVGSALGGPLLGAAAAMAAGYFQAGAERRAARVVTQHRDLEVGINALIVGANGTGTLTERIKQVAAYQIKRDVLREIGTFGVDEKENDWKRGFHEKWRYLKESWNSLSMEQKVGGVVAGTAAAAAGIAAIIFGAPIIGAVAVGAAALAGMAYVAKAIFYPEAGIAERAREDMTKQRLAKTKENILERIRNHAGHEARVKNLEAHGFTAEEVEALDRQAAKELSKELETGNKDKVGNELKIEFAKSMGVTLQNQSTQMPVLIQFQEIVGQDLLRVSRQSATAGLNVEGLG